MTDELDEILLHYSSQTFDADYEANDDKREQARIEATQAINAYILGEVMELIGEDELKGMYTPLQWEIAQDRNYLRQELRNKAIERFGGK
jgi:hypothetical protein